LTSIDFGNCELNTNKNKLRNIGAVSLVHGILESKHGQGYSLISEINLSYNYLTQECLPYFAKLCDPSFIQVKNLNLSFNALGSDAIKILEPIIPNLTVLNLNGCKLNNSSMSHLADIFNNERVLLEELYLNNNNITTDGFHRLIVQLKTHNRVRHLNFSHNDIASDITTFSTVQKFLCVNSALEYLDISHCNLNEKAGEAIGKGLRGNRNL
jgi:Ran GTPase-activating protein (RanGAP) involved in mRNA processing and transport